jgi:hypothetical protein
MGKEFKIKKQKVTQIGDIFVHYTFEDGCLVSKEKEKKGLYYLSNEEVKNFEKKRR